MANVFIIGNTNCTKDSLEYNLAKEIGAKVSKCVNNILTGGFKGVAEGVYEGAKAANENCGRISILCKEIRLPHNNLHTMYLDVASYFDYIKLSINNSDLFVFLPGNFSILSFLSVCLNLQELNLFDKPKPIICVGEQLREVIEMLAFFNEDVIEIYKNIIMVSSAEEVVEAIRENI